MRAEENTIVSSAVPGHIAVRRIGQSGHAPSSLQVSCEVLHRPDNTLSSVLRIAGSVDSSTSDELLAKIAAQLGISYLARLIIDLEGVARLDSSGVGVLLTALRDSQKRGVRFTLCSLSRPLFAMLERMHLASLFEIRATLADAVNF